MNNEKEQRTELQLLSPAHLVDAIFDSEHPERVVKKVPAQQLYLAVKARGISSSGDLITIASVEQCRLMMDIDLWHGDRFSEKQLFEWLAIADAEEDLDLVRKVIVSSDLKLIAYLIQKYVDIEVFEEPTDQPPFEKSYTPDKGHTWIHIKHPESDQHFLLGRMLAVIHDYDARLFYQLIAIPGVATLSDLEEQSFEEREKRIQGEGIPDHDWCLSLHTPFLLVDAKKELEAASKTYDASMMEALLPYESLEKRVNTLLLEDSCKEAYTLLMSAACRYYDIDYGNGDLLSRLFRQIRGTALLGIGNLVAELGYSPEFIVETLGLSGAYRRGIGILKELKRTANSVSFDVIKLYGPESKIFELIAGLKEDIPMLPDWFSMETNAETLTEVSIEKADFIGIERCDFVNHCRLVLLGFINDIQHPHIH